ncbi:YadA-like family protein [Vibrio sp. ZSDE26]|uniref:YadA-like family protein n=1 Tax=Vibrio amylolyticus TaxID=2847292 RepID=A0A9X2BK05_9VIBR|nr:YadA C-terminal domain-containing protein [Vibrio amylolyticus]MCK6262298.1 YadA-like family protein [Vibrio amylolyticus]
MKKTILATLIAATSFGAMASDDVVIPPTTGSEFIEWMQDPTTLSEDKVNVINTWGASDPFGNGKTIEVVVKGDGNAYLMYDNGGEKQSDINLSDLFDGDDSTGSKKDKMQLSLLKNQLEKQGTDKWKSDLEPIAPIYDKENVKEGIKNRTGEREQLGDTNDTSDETKLKRAIAVEALNTMSTKHGGDVFVIEEDGTLTKGGETVTGTMIADAKEQVKAEAQARQITPIEPIDEFVPAPPSLSPEERAVREQAVVDNLTFRANNVTDNATDEQKFALLVSEAGKQGYEVSESGDDLVFTKVNEVGVEEAVTISKSDIQDAVSAKGTELAETKARKDAERAEAGNPTIIEPTLPGDDIGEARDNVKAAIITLAETGQLSKEELSTYATTQASVQTAIDDRQDAQIDANTVSINDLYSQVDRLDEKMDGVMASTQAVTAARPYMGANQTNAIGVGLGHAGDAQSMAIGYGHRMNENWTANANVSITTASDTDVSVGAGVGYAW